MTLSPKVEGCGCLALVNAELSKTGHALSSTMFGNPDRPLIAIVRKDTWRQETRKSKPRNLSPTYCPFCGLRYPGTISPFEKGGLFHKESGE